MKKMTQKNTFHALSGFLFPLAFLATSQAHASDFITGEQQLSVKEKRAGEAYYRADSKWMIYQAEVADDNPFYQIFLKNIESGAVTQVSPGTGKTTCAWVHPAQEKVLFSSTHDDKEAKAKMAAEIERRSAVEAQEVKRNHSIFILMTPPHLKVKWPCLKAHLLFWNELLRSWSL